MDKQSKTNPNPEQQRIDNQHLNNEPWDQWGPYLAERAWGTVREDYSSNGTAWEYFDHQQAPARAYRWNEDGMGGVCDDQQRLCLALALWNNQDALLKERAFGLTGNQGNRGEDVKEYYFYLDATPSHSYLRYLYKYPFAAYPYQWLVNENRQRNRLDPPFNLLDTGVFSEHQYWDIDVRYAKAQPDQIHLSICAHNRSAIEQEIHLIPQLWFRNTWSWSTTDTKPVLQNIQPPEGASWAVQADHPTLGRYYLYGKQAAQGLFTENETNTDKLWQTPNQQPYVKDAFHRYIVSGEQAAVNPQLCGTKFGAWHRFQIGAGQMSCVELLLSAQPLEQPFAQHQQVMQLREQEADAFYQQRLPEAEPVDKKIFRQALAGMIWSKQFFHYDVQRWLNGDQLPPPDSRRQGRNKHWRHVRAADIISMPDCWEYPWFAAWDTAYHCAALALIDVDFAKRQIELMLKETYLHPNGQIPAYEWAFGDANPPVHAWGALKVFRTERVQRKQGDLNFLRRVFHKLLLNYAWWINRKDKEGHNLFEGGFLGLDNISVYDRSRALPHGFSLKQADATGWMAMFSLNMTVIALELTTQDATYEDMAIQCYEQFLAIANAIAGDDQGNASLWDMDSGFFKDLLITPSGEQHYIDVYSWVGLIPLFACEVIDQRLLKNAPRFSKRLSEHKGGLFRGNYICACPDWENERGEHLLALVDHSMLPRILQRLLAEDQFLSRYGVRSVSRVHESYQHLGNLPGIGATHIEYVPGESTTGLFGGNSNWRGPIWMPTNYSLIQSLEKFHRFLGDGFSVNVPFLDNQRLNLKEIATLLSQRLVDLYHRDAEHHIPALRNDSPCQSDEHWQDMFLFYEYFHAETGQGLGAAHQTGWTGLIANLILRKYRKDIPSYWKKIA